MTALFLGPFFAIYGQAGNDLIHFYLPMLGVIFTYVAFAYLAYKRHKIMGIALYSVFVSFFFYYQTTSRDYNAIPFMELILGWPQAGTTWLLGRPS